MKSLSPTMPILPRRNHEHESSTHHVPFVGWLVARPFIFRFLFQPAHRRKSVNQPWVRIPPLPPYSATPNQSDYPWDENEVRTQCSGSPHCRLGNLPIATAAANDDVRKVYGSAFLDAYFEPGQEIHNAIKLRYKCRVIENLCLQPEMWKIIFMFHFLHAPGNAKTYEIQSNLYTWRFAYPHLSKRTATGEVEGLRNLPGESGLFLSVPDNHRDRKTGARTRSPNMFPTLDQEIDGIRGLWKREQVSQTNVAGQTLSIEIARGKVAADLRGWSVHGDLPGGKYRVWTITVSWAGASYHADFALPEDGAKYFIPTRMAQIATEAFYVHPGSFKACFWNLEIQRENETVWHPIQKWKLTESDAKAGENTWGMKRSEFENHSVIEVSNDGTKTYASKGEFIELN
jgi:hypothetical protein